MNILKLTAKTIAVAGVVVTLAAAPSFALYSECVGEGTDYPELSTTQSKDYPIKCVTVTDGDTAVTFYSKRSSDCAKAGTIAANQSLCDDEEAIAEDVDDEDEAEDEELIEEEEEEGEEKAKEETSKQEDTKKTESKKDDPTMMIVIIAVAAIAVILLIVLFVVLSKKKGNKNSGTPEAPTTPVETEASVTEESTTSANEPEAPAVETETKTAESETPVATETPVGTPTEPELVDPFAQTESTVDPNKTNE
jgi:hypothetical protein